MGLVERHSSLGSTDGEPVAEVIVRFYPAGTPDRAIGGCEIRRSVDERLDGRLDVIRQTLNALLDEMQGETTAR